MAKLLQILRGYPKPAFSKKVQGGDEEKFFKNRPTVAQKESEAIGIIL